MSAEQDAAIDVGVPLVSLPVIDVMHLAPTGRTIAHAELASAISRGHAHPLPATEESILATEIHNFAVVGESDGQKTGRARVAFDGRDGHAFSLALDEPEATASPQVSVGDQKLDSGSLRAQHDRRIGRSADADQLDERIQCELLGGAIIGDHLFCPRSERGIDEPRSPTPRRGDRVEGGGHDRGTLRIEQARQSRHAVSLRVEMQVAPRTQVFLAFGDPIEVQR
ncbi:MAG TPA: hypothetical protein PKY48_10900 [Rhodoglobus sp.]|nr:hypothetical protein [Rhodoglobus sp.]